MVRLSARLFRDGYLYDWRAAHTRHLTTHSRDPEKSSVVLCFLYSLLALKCNLGNYIIFSRLENLLPYHYASISNPCPPLPRRLIRCLPAFVRQETPFPNPNDRCLTSDQLPPLTSTYRQHNIKSESSQSTPSLAWYTHAERPVTLIAWSNELSLVHLLSLPLPR